MTQKFHEGQDVEVRVHGDKIPLQHYWQKAKICDPLPVGNEWVVQFPSGTRAVFDAENVRAASMECSYDHGSGHSGRLWQP